MAVRQTSMFCPQCRKFTLHVKHVFGGGMGCLLTLLTGGLFLVIWVLADVAGIVSPYRCQFCGKARTGFAGTLLSIVIIIALIVGIVAMFQGTSHPAATDKKNAPRQAGGPEAQPAKPIPPNREEDSQELVIEGARALMGCYESNEVKADQDCKDKLFAVRGIVDTVGKDILDTPYVTFKGDGVFCVQCMFSKKDEKQLAELNPGDRVTIAGVCKGKMGNVIMRDCYFYKPKSLPKPTLPPKPTGPAKTPTEDILRPSTITLAPVEGDRPMVPPSRPGAPTHRPTTIPEDPEVRANNLLQLAENLMEAGKVEAAMERYRMILEKYPKTKAAEAAKGKIASPE